MSLTLRRLIGIYTIFRYFGYSYCGRCWHTWPTVESHSTEWKPGHGCFPLCEQCWQELTPETRLPYYESLYNQWLKDLPSNTPPFEDIKAAVLAEGGESK